MTDLDWLLREGISSGQIAGSIDDHGRHSLGLAASADEGFEFDGRVADLGSGVGLPSLLLADAYPDTHWTLIERRTGRADLLKRAVARLRWEDRIEVLALDAAEAGRASHRGRSDVVTSRSFGPPSIAAELGAPLLRPGGSMIVSEPRARDPEIRWPAAGLSRCGLVFAERWETEAGSYVRLLRTDDPIDELPRPGARKRSLF